MTSAGRVGTVGGVSWQYGSDPDRPWFRVGRFGVGTTDFVAALSLVMMVVYAISPTFVNALALVPSQLGRGFVWGLVTWPLANAPSFFTVLNAVVFWFTGRQLERQLGKARFGWMLLAITVLCSVLAVLLSLAFQANAPILAGLDTLSLLVVLLFIAENPRMPFFFGIPAWVLGAVLVAIPLLQYVAMRYWIGLLHFVLSLVGAAWIAKLAGLLERLHWVPGHMWTPGERRRRRRRAADANPGGVVVQGPWSGAEPPAREDSEMDALLDKIMAQGLDSLTPRERRRLEELRQQRRRG